MKPRIPHDCWVLACDGGRALMMRNAGNSELLNLIVIETVANPGASARMLGSDREGTVFQSVSGARSKVEQTDLHRQAEERFVANIAERISALVRNEGIQRLVLAAPPRVLGQLRTELDPHVRSVISAELGKDLVNLEVADIEKYLTD